MPVGDDHTTTQSTAAKTTPRSKRVAAVKGKGQVVFSITAEINPVQSVKAANVTISKTELHAKGGSWVTVNTTAGTYDLFDLKAKQRNALMSDSTVAAGVYDQVRLTVDKVALSLENGTTTEARMPSKTITLSVPVTVEADKDSSVNFDFDADDSLYSTEAHEYVFAPVVVVKTRHDANVYVADDNMVTIWNQGTVDAPGTKFGMDTSGIMKADFKIDAKYGLEIVNGTIRVKTLK